MPPNERVAIVQLPSWLHGGKPRALLESGNLHVKQTSSGWLVQTSESYLRRSPDLVSSADLAGPAVSREALDQLATVPEVVSPSRSARILDAVQQRRARAEATGSPVDGMASWQLDFMVTPIAELPALARGVMDRLRASVLEGTSQTIFDNAGIHLVRRSPSLVWRIKIATVLVQIAQDPRLDDGDLTRTLQDHNSGRRTFVSASGLLDGLYSFETYLGPMLACLSPSVWAFSATRSFGNIIITLGRPLAGTEGDPVELLQLVHTQGPRAGTRNPALGPLASSSAVNWWCQQLNKLFGVMTDPSAFVDGSRVYRGATHLHGILTLEQLFERVTSALVSHRDSNARRVLLFTVLDSLERLTNRTLERHCTLSTAEKTLNALRESLPADAAECLLPGAERAVDALRELQAGFFMANRSRAESVELTIDGERKQLTLEDAASKYLKALRDATHGHGSDKPQVRSRTDALIAQHDGEVPHDLGFLGYLYLLDVLVNPTRLRTIMRSNSRGPRGGRKRA